MSDPSVRPAPTSAPAPGVVRVHSDVRCPWAHVVVHRLAGAVEALGAEGEVLVDHRWFPVGARPGPDDVALRDVLAPIAALEPGAGWEPWPDGVAFPADGEVAAAWIHAAKAQGVERSVALDRALRRAVFVDHADVADETVVADVAGAVAGLDADALGAEVDRARTEVDVDAEVADDDAAIEVSPTLVLADGTVAANPGLDFHLEDGIPVVDRDEPAELHDLLESAVATRRYD